MHMMVINTKLCAMVVGYSGTVPARGNMRKLVDVGRPSIQKRRVSVQKRGMARQLRMMKRISKRYKIWSSIF